MGGSELLWYACARRARRDGAAVYASLYDSPSARAATRELAAGGAELNFRARYPKASRA